MPGHKTLGHHKSHHPHKDKHTRSASGRKHGHGMNKQHGHGQHGHGQHGHGMDKSKHKHRISKRKHSKHNHSKHNHSKRKHGKHTHSKRKHRHMHKKTRKRGRGDARPANRNVNRPREMLMNHNMEFADSTKLSTWKGYNKEQYTDPEWYRHISAIVDGLENGRIDEESITHAEGRDAYRMMSEGDL